MVTIFNFKFFSIKKNLYKNKVVNPSEKRSCAKFEPFVTNSFAKMAKNDLSFFCDFTFLPILTLKMTSKFKFDLIRPT